jgi:perosamine synthetase
VIEDACESLGATYDGKMTGTFGDAGVYAFYPNKQMTTGEGGVIVSDSQKLIELCKSLRNQGRNQKSDWLIHERLGFNYRMDEMSAALGVSQLKKIKMFIEERRKIARWYAEFLCKNKNIILPQVGEGRTHTWFVFVIRVLNGRRDFLMNKLSELKIQTKTYLPVIHLQPFMKKMFRYKPGDFPVAEKIANQTLALPIYVDLTRNDVKYICKKINKIL